MTTRLLIALGIVLSLSAFASPASAKSGIWYAQRSCQFYPGGGRRTPQEIAACQGGAQQGSHVRFCRDHQRVGWVPCGRNQ
jgi:hypothetical protein